MHDLVIDNARLIDGLGGPARAGGVVGVEMPVDQVRDVLASPDRPDFNLAPRVHAGVAVMLHLSSSFG